MRSHQAHPLNEFADAAAKAGARGQLGVMLPTCLQEALDCHILPWLWSAMGLHPHVPAVSDTGALADSATIQTPPRPNADSHSAVWRFDFKAATYNCLTLQSQAQKESLAAQFLEQGFQVVGLQETRVATRGRGSNGRYHVLHSAAADGQFGCQLWLAKDLPIATFGRQTAVWDPHSFCIIHDEPRLLLATARAGDCLFSFVVAHGLTTRAGAAACQAWWQHLTSATRRLPPRGVPLVFIDANKHNHDPERHVVISDRVNANQKGLTDFAAAHRLQASGYKTGDGVPFVTWVGPSGQQACLDYILCPSSLSAGMHVIGPLSDFVGHLDHDHKPLAVSFQLTGLGSARTKARRIDPDVLRTPAGRQALQSLYRQFPPVPWEVSVDEHLQQLNDHLVKGLQKICPRLANRPRDPITSDGTWELIRERREVRRHMHGVADPQAWQEYLGFLGEQVKDYTKRIRQSARQDAAQALRSSFQEARARGVEAVHSLCRRITKSGRRYREPALCPALRLADGTIAADSHKILGDHFADAERAAVCQIEELTTRPATYAADSFPAAAGLTVESLCRAFSSLTTRRAPGSSSIPPEAYQAAPLDAAHQHIAIVLKAQMRKQCPLLWRGGLATAIPKPSKPLYTTAGWRSILLVEAGAKGIAKALRDELLRSFETVRQPAQGGSAGGSSSDSYYTCSGTCTTHPGTAPLRGRALCGWKVGFLQRFARVRSWQGCLPAPSLFRTACCRSLPWRGGPSAVSAPNTWTWNLRIDWRARRGPQIHSRESGRFMVQHWHASHPSVQDAQRHGARCTAR